MTKFAKTMLELIETSCSHMTAEQVFHALRQVYPKVALATVYNNLNRLWEEGRLRKVSIEGCLTGMTASSAMTTWCDRAAANWWISIWGI